MYKKLFEKTNKKIIKFLNPTCVYIGLFKDDSIGVYLDISLLWWLLKIDSGGS